MVPVTRDTKFPPALRELAALRGVGLSYVDGRRDQRDADPDIVVAVLNSFDDMEPIGSSNDARAALRQRRQQALDRVVEPVYVVDEGVESVLSIRLKRSITSIECRIEFEFGGEINWAVSSDMLAASSRPRGAEGQKFALSLPAMRVGYHHLHLSVGRVSVRSTLIVRPLRGARHRFAHDWRAYSVQTPIFSLHSRRSWGAGDVGDLDEFARLVSNQHATVVSTLPLLATFGPNAFESSPYRPVSRRFWSDRWIALDQVDDLASSPAAQHLMNVTYAAERRAAWTVDGVVDGAAAFAAKRSVIQAWAATQSEFVAQHESGLQSFLMDHPDVNDYARFRAAGERFGLDFHHWPTTAKSGLLRWNDVDPSIVRYHVLAQWIIDVQMTDLSSRLAQRGQTLELDVPVGVHPFGYDVWRNPEQYVTSMSIGSPPDDLTVTGQTWGSPPPHPENCRNDAHARFREALRFHMRVAGIVRIDHVMGLQRLFWVPQGASADQGVYVSMPFKELLAIVAVEAQRLGVDIVGEDLGTVEADLRQAMRRDGLRRTYVAQFAIGDEGLDEVPAGSVASFSTHDTATFFGWWSGADIDEREQLGLLDALIAESSRDERDALRQKLADAVGRSVDDEPGDILAAVHAWLADSDAGLVMVQLEDLLGERSAVNIPGTLHERPNWSRLTSSSLEELATSTTLARTLEPLRESRGYASTGAGAPLTTLLSANDLHLMNEGRHFRLYQHLGCHPMIAGGVEGCYFAVWAPNADRVSVVGDFNDWDGTTDRLFARENSGVWEGFVAGVPESARYKYRLHSRLGGDDVDKADPFGRYFEVPSRTATRVWESAHEWADDEWMRRRGEHDPRERPVSVYEVHLGSWRRVPEDGNRSLTYRESAPLLAQYALDMGFTHVQLLPVMEHPFYGSWGYQTTGYFAPTSRMGTPDDFKYLVDHLHQRGVGVLLDWVPSHFPADAFALAQFDGTHLYEHADVRQRVHPDWQSWTFNYGRNEVRSFLISSACFWLDEYHVDGLRLDAVASMLYLDYSRAAGEWVPNRHGGHEDLDAVSFLRQCTDEATSSFPGVMMIAEESTSWPGVTASTEHGGLGFTFKWDLGWMHDTLDYLSRDAVHRRFHQGELTFRAIYASNEHFMLPLSHDEVVHGKGSVLARMAGDAWQQRANLRLLFGYQFTLPGKKLLFMGDEFAQGREWDHEQSLDWHLLHSDEHQGVARWVRRLNALYRDERALWRDDAQGDDFTWVACDDADQSVLIWQRGSGEHALMMIANFTPVPREFYDVAVSSASTWTVLANSDDVSYAGSGYLDRADFVADAHEGGATLHATLPPLSLLVLKRKE